MKNTSPLLQYRFVTSVFGNANRYFGMLTALLFSIKETNPEASASILWEGMDSKRLSLLKGAFPEFEFIETHFEFSNDKIKLISSKTLLWEYASSLKMNEMLVFVDVDMLIVKNLSSIILKDDFDVIFTKKNELYPINTGMLVCRNNEKTHAFFELWKEKTKNILNDKVLFAQSGSRDFPYGGADQMALYQMLDFDFKKENYLLSLGGATINVKSMPCAVLNETNSTTISDYTHIIHYKGGWQLILIDGDCFTKNRPKKDSWEMYVYYLKTFLRAMRYVNKINVCDLNSNFFGIKVPFYIDTTTWQENTFLYFLYSIQCFIRLGLKKIKKLCKHTS